MTVPGTLRRITSGAATPGAMSTNPVPSPRSPGWELAFTSATRRAPWPPMKLCHRPWASGQTSHVGGFLWLVWPVELQGPFRRWRVFCSFDA